MADRHATIIQHGGRCSFPPFKHSNATMDEIQAEVKKQDLNKRWPELRKASRAGGPVTCVSCRRSLPARRENDDGEDTSPSWVQVWALGPYLFRSFQNKTDELLVFPQETGGSIHAISYLADEDDGTAPPSRYAVVYGGRQLAICSVFPYETDQKLADMKKINLSGDQVANSILIASDWIWDVKCFRRTRNSDDNNDDNKNSTCITMALGLGRHTIELWNLLARRHVSGNFAVELTQQRRFSGAPSCLVMSIHMLLHPSNDRLWIAAGTAFQVIQVWSIPLFGSLNDKQTENHRLVGHAGVIHSVKFSDDARFIISTSDDRSVRLWNNSSPTDTASEFHAEGSWNQKWVGWGHTARVWSADFAAETVVSVAEDATLRIWSIETGATMATIHHSTGLWGVCTFEDMAMVGAADGTVSTYSLSDRIAGKNLQVNDSVTVPDDRPKSLDKLLTEEDVLSNDVATKKKKKAYKVISQVVVGMRWLNQTELLLSTREGSLFKWKMQGQFWEDCKDWWDPSLFDLDGINANHGCCMIVRNGWVAIGTTLGDIVVTKILPRDGVSDSNVSYVLSAKSLKSVQGFRWIENHHFLVSFHVRAVAVWYFDEGHILSKPSLKLILSMETKGVPISCAHDDVRKQLLVGDSRGNISVFEIPDTLESRDIQATIKPFSLLLMVHKKEHVNDIVIVGDTVISSGNDGYLFYSFRNDGQLEMGFSVPVMAMSGIVRIWRLGHNRIAVAGYYGNTYRVVDVTTGYEYFQIDTGGRQRIVDFFWDTSNGAVSGPKCMGICMNKKDGSNKLMISAAESRRTMNDGMGKSKGPSSNVAVHGETIFDVCFFSLGNTCNCAFLLTASEDCGSKVFLCINGRLSSSIALTPQESCVRAVYTSQIDSTTSLLVVGGGKLVIQFFLARYLPRSRSSCASLLDVKFEYLGRNLQLKKASIDQRINTVKAVPTKGGCRKHLVIAGDSAGNLHLSMVSESRSTRRPTDIVVHVSDRPILCIDMVTVFERMIMVAVGTTSGVVALYYLPMDDDQLLESWESFRETQTWQVLASFPAHTMGANAISLSVDEGGDTGSATATIMSGGDDQALFLCRVQLIESHGALSATSLEVFKEPYASFSAVKGVARLAFSTGAVYVTTGYTQRIALWKAKPSSELGLDLLQHLPVDIGDVNAVAVLNQGGSFYAVVVGIGIELFSIGDEAKTSGSWLW